MTKVNAGPWETSVRRAGSADMFALSTNNNHPKIPNVMNKFTSSLFAVAFTFAVSVFIALFASLRDRRYELALMRTMGAPPRRLFTLVLFEGLWMTVAGIAIGLALSRLGVMVLAGALADRFHYDVAQLAPVSGEGFLVVAALAVGTLAAALPARSALRIDISNTLGQGR